MDLRGRGARRPRPSARRCVPRGRRRPGRRRADRLLRRLSGAGARQGRRCSAPRSCPAAPARRPRRATMRAELLALADRLAWRARGPSVLAVAGASASTGKTTLAAALVRRVRVVRGSARTWPASSWSGLAPTARAPQAAYSRAGQPRRPTSELGRLAGAGRRARDRGRDVPAPVRTRCLPRGARVVAGRRRRVRRVPRRPPRRSSQRAAARLADADRVSDATPEVARRQLREFEALDEVPAVDHLLVRADQSLEALVGEVGEALDRRLGGAASRKRLDDPLNTRAA